jgi:membrane-associated phospholipid phosphatase
MTDAPGSVRPLADDVRLLGRAVVEVARDLVRTAARLDGRGWLLLVSLLAATGLAYADKWPLVALAQWAHPPGAFHLATFIRYAGAGVAWILVGSVAFVAGRWTRYTPLVEAATALAAGGLWCWLLTDLGQWVLAEQRPVEGGAMRLFSAGGHGVSGHASLAGLLFFPCQLLARRASPRGRATTNAIVVGWAALVAWSRMWLGMHFLWNVMLGLGLGTWTGLVATRVVSRLLDAPATATRTIRASR